MRGKDEELIDIFKFTETCEEMGRRVNKNDSRSWKEYFKPLKLIRTTGTHCAN